jgi:two-component system response regulator NreC
MTNKIILADDHEIVREGLKSLLSKHDDMEVVAEAADGREVLGLVEVLSPDIVVMDVTMPGLNGIDATRRISEEHPEVRVVGLSMHSDRQFVGGMLGAGASAYLLKDCAFEELVKAIRVVVSGEIFLSPKIAGDAMHDYLKHVRGEQVMSSDESQILQLVVEGKTLDDIANEFGETLESVEGHWQSIVDKFGTESVAKLTKHAIREGITSLDP